MIGKITFSFIVLLLCTTGLSPLTIAGSFSNQDLMGTWHGHHLVSGDAPADDPRWGYGTVVIGNSGGYTATWTSPTQTNEVSTGTIQITSAGLITVDNQTHGIMSDTRDLVVFVDGTDQSQGNALTVMVKRETGVIFNTSNLSGTWYGHHTVGGDAPNDDPRWGYGTVVIGNSGGYTSTWTSPTQTNEVSSGTIQINSNGIVTIDNQSLTHGVMNNTKDFLVFIDGSSQSQGNGLAVMLKRQPGISFNTSDLAGIWYGHHVVTGDAPADDPRWGYGKIIINSTGNFSVSWTSPTQANEISSGTIQINANGIFTINNQSLIHGAMSDGKDILVFIDGTSQSQGNALTIMIRGSTTVQSGVNLLLLN